MGGHSRQRRRAAESTRAILGMEEREGRWRAGDEAARRGVRVWGQLTQDLVCWANGFYALSNEELFFFFPSSYFYSWQIFKKQNSGPELWTLKMQNNESTISESYNPKAILAT